MGSGVISAGPEKGVGSIFRNGPSRGRGKSLPTPFRIPFSHERRQGEPLPSAEATHEHHRACLGGVTARRAARQRTVDLPAQRCRALDRAPGRVAGSPEHGGVVCLRRVRRPHQRGGELLPRFLQRVHAGTPLRPLDRDVRSLAGGAGEGTCHRRTVRACRGQPAVRGAATLAVRVVGAGRCRLLADHDPARQYRTDPAVAHLLPHHAARTRRTARAARGAGRTRRCPRRQRVRVARQRPVRRRRTRRSRGSAARAGS